MFAKRHLLFCAIIVAWVLEFFDGLTLHIFSTLNKIMFKPDRFPYSFTFTFTPLPIFRLRTDRSQGRETFGTWHAVASGDLAEVMRVCHFGDTPWRRVTLLKSWECVTLLTRLGSLWISWFHDTHFSDTSWHYVTLLTYWQCVGWLKCLGSVPFADDGCTCLLQVPQHRQVVLPACGRRAASVWLHLREVLPQRQRLGGGRWGQCARGRCCSSCGEGGGGESDGNPGRTVPLKALSRMSEIS